MNRRAGERTSCRTQSHRRRSKGTGENESNKSTIFKREKDGSGIADWFDFAGYVLRTDIKIFRKRTPIGEGEEGRKEPFGESEESKEGCHARRADVFGRKRRHGDKVVFWCDGSSVDATGRDLRPLPSVDEEQATLCVHRFHNTTFPAPSPFRLFDVSTFTNKTSCCLRSLAIPFVARRLVLWEPSATSMFMNTSPWNCSSTTVLPFQRRTLPILPTKPRTSLCTVSTEVSSKANQYLQEASKQASKQSSI